MKMFETNDSSVVVRVFIEWSGPDETVCADLFGFALAGGRLPGLEEVVFYDNKHHPMKNFLRVPVPEVLEVDIGSFPATRSMVGVYAFGPDMKQWPAGTMARVRVIDAVTGADILSPDPLHVGGCCAIHLLNVMSTEGGCGVVGVGERGLYGPSKIIQDLMDPEYVTG